MSGRRRPLRTPGGGARRGCRGAHRDVAVRQRPDARLGHLRHGRRAAWPTATGTPTGSGGAIDLFPPGYSAVLSIGDRLGADVLDVGRALSVVTLAVTVFLGWLLVRRHVRSAAIQAVTTIVIGCSAVLLEIYAKLLSEHLFVPVVLGFVLACELIVEHPRSVSWPAAAVGLAWAGFYLRYAGLALVAYSACSSCCSRAGPIAACGAGCAIAFSVAAERAVDLDAAEPGRDRQPARTPIAVFDLVPRQRGDGS